MGKNMKEINKKNFVEKILLVFEKYLLPPKEKDNGLSNTLDKLDKELNGLRNELSEIEKTKNTILPIIRNIRFKRFPLIPFLDYKSMLTQWKTLPSETRYDVLFVQAFRSFWQKLQEYVPKGKNDLYIDTGKELIIKPEQRRKNRNYALDLISLYFKDKIKELNVNYDITNLIMHLCGIYEYDEDVRIFADSREPIILLGKSGTGKELHARAIHYISNRSKNPFIPVNCGGLNEETIHSELFGHVKGAFTGAINSKEGAFQKADKGTLFLDEIADMCPKVQTALLRTLNDGEVQKLGETGSPKTVDVRVIAATNKDLKYEMEEGAFREDLFYRLDVFSISLSPLRELKEEFNAILFSKILDIIWEQWPPKDNFKMNGVHNKKIPLLSLKLGDTLFPEIVEQRVYPSNKNMLGMFTEDALNALTDYSYPGNYRELEGILKNAYQKSRGIIDIEHLPEKVKIHSTASIPETPTETWQDLPYQEFTQKLHDLHRSKIESALKQSKGNIKKTAEQLGVPDHILRNNLIKNLGINIADFK